MAKTFDFLPSDFYKNASISKKDQAMSTPVEPFNILTAKVPDIAEVRAARFKADADRFIGGVNSKLKGEEAQSAFNSYKAFYKVAPSPQASHDLTIGLVSKVVDGTDKDRSCCYSFMAIGVDALGHHLGRQDMQSPHLAETMLATTKFALYADLFERRALRQQADFIMADHVDTEDSRAARGRILDDPETKGAEFLYLLSDVKRSAPFAVSLMNGATQAVRNGVINDPENIIAFGENVPKAVERFRNSPEVVAAAGDYADALTRRAIGPYQEHPKSRWHTHPAAAVADIAQAMPAEEGRKLGQKWIEGAFAHAVDVDPKFSHGLLKKLARQPQAKAVLPLEVAQRLLDNKIKALPGGALPAPRKRTSKGVAPV